MSINSKRKGKTGELEISHILQEHGYNARRSQQFCGANGDADVVGLPGVHIEVKRTETLSLYPALEQATQDAREDEIPVVPSRKEQMNNSYMPRPSAQKRQPSASVNDMDMDEIFDILGGN